MPDHAARRKWFLLDRLLFCFNCRQRKFCDYGPEVLLSFPAYPSRQEAIVAGQEAMRATFGSEVRFEPIPPFKKAPRTFQVLDSKGHHLEIFNVFRTVTGKWAWQEATPRS
jgi:hypothetical protein